MTAEKFYPRFTTSAKKAEAEREDREERLGKNFHQRIRTVEGTRPPTNVRPAKDPWEEAEKRKKTPATSVTDKQQKQKRRRKK